MVAVPAPTGVTLPSATVATAGLSLVHVTALLVALSGDTVAVRVFASPPTVSARVVGARVTPVTAMVPAFAVTVTVHVAVLPPSTVVTVMVAVPAPTGVTLPSTTVTTEGLSLVHVTALLVALSGNTVAVRVFASPPTVSARVVGSRVTPVTAMGAISTSVANAPSLSTMLCSFSSNLPPSGFTI